MNLIHRLERRVREKFPGIDALVTPPIHEHAPWRLDLKNEKRSAVVECCDEAGIKIWDTSAPEESGKSIDQDPDMRFWGEEGAFEALAAIFGKP